MTLSRQESDDLIFQYPAGVYKVRHLAPEGKPTIIAWANAHTKVGDRIQMTQKTNHRETIMTALNLKTSPSASKQNAENITPRSSGKLSREAFVSWLFLIGSLMFVLDAILENVRGVSFSSVLHLVASILFTIGSVLFIPNDSQQDL
ncbi:MAG: hypothetical protein AAGF01_19755 [Cyanobacteria bacterium P01_G01_bin.38]